MDLTPIHDAFNAARELRAVFHPFLAVVTATLSRTDDFDERGPKTQFNEFRASAQQALDSIPRRMGETALRKAAAVAARPVVTGWLRRRVDARVRAKDREFAGDPLHRQLQQYVQQVEAELPGIWMFLASRSLPKAEAFGVKLFAIRSRDFRFKRATGERRSEELKSLTVEVTENFHQLFVSSLELVERLRRGSKLPEGETYGTKLRHLADWRGSTLGAIAKPEYVRIRNAASHEPGWNDSDDFGTVRLRDPDADYDQSFTHEELFARLDELVTALVALNDVVAVEVLRTASKAVFQTPLLDLLATESDALTLKLAFDRAVDEILRAPRERFAECTSS
jgi:hypothetical protein